MSDDINRDDTNQATTQTKKLVMSKRTVRNLAVRSRIATGAIFTNDKCSATRSCQGEHTCKSCNDNSGF